jgi:serine protease AprX
MDTQRKKKLSLVAALAVCAGTAASVHADVSVPAGARTMAVPGSNMVIAVWRNAGSSNVAVSLNGATFDGVTQPDYKIKLGFAQFDPIKGTPSVPPSLAAGPQNELFLVQSWAAPLEPMQEAITAAGGVIERYVADYTLVVRLTPEAKAAVSELPFVRWVGAYHPAYRVDAQTLAFVTSSTDAPSRFSIETMRNGPQQQQALSALITALGGAVNVMTLDMQRMEATLTPSQLLAVVQQNEVNFVDPWLGPGGHDMDILRQYGGAVPILSGVGITGQGVRGEIFDTEVTAAHPQWNGQTPLIHGVNGNSGTHGSSCYGINFATGNTNAQATGMCPSREQGIFCHYPQASSFGGATSRLTLNTQLVNPGGTLRGHYQTSSVGNPQISNYSTISAETDNYLFQVDLLSCQSQSNTGSTLSRPEAWAKNIMAVGGFTQGPPPGTLTKTDDTSSGASFGYAQDGRMKPELCHAYFDIFTTTAGTGYTQFNGTSGATPIVAGHFGLLHQMWHIGVWSGHGGAPGVTVFGDTPKSTTARAIMIAGAFRYDWAAPSLVNGHINATLTRNRQGWGVPDVGRLMQMAAKTFIVNESDVLAALESTSYSIEVAAGEQRLNISMVYADPQGNPATPTQHRINDVDLKVTSPTGSVYWGNYGLTQPHSPGGVHSNWSTASAVGVNNPDLKNTCENVNVFQPAAGTWTVEVIATQLVADGHLETPGIDVDYALVVVGGTEGGPCYPDCNGVGGLTIADFGCFQTAFVAGDPYADCDGLNGLTIADFGCFQTAFVAGCP